MVGTVRGGGWSKVRKIWKHDFEITGDPKLQKVPQVGQLFVGFSGPRLWAVGPRPDVGPKTSKMANKAQNRDIDNSLLSSHKT